jgi:hypothetical protein
MFRGDGLEISRVPSVDGRKYCFEVPTSFFLVRHRDTVFITGNSGKSTGCVVEIVRRCKQQSPGPDGVRRSRWAIVRNTASQLKDTTLKTWLEWVPDGIAGRWKESDKTFYLEFGDVYAEILFRPLDSPADVQRVLSLDLTGAWLNEAREIPKEIVQAIQGRLGRYPSKGVCPDGWYGLIADTNPPEEDTFWHKVLEQLPVEGEDMNSVFTCSVYKQPSGLAENAENRENLPTNYYENLAKGKTRDWINTYVHGMYSPSLHGVPVYRNTFKREIHVSRTRLEASPTLPVIVGMDFGRTPAAVFKQMTPDGRIKVIRELPRFDMGLDIFISQHMLPLIRNEFPGMRLVIIGDPAGVRRNDTDEGNCFKMLREKFGSEGHVIKPAQTNDPLVRIQATERALVQFPGGSPMYVIDPSCTMLIQGFTSKYRYATVKGHDVDHKASPDKNNWSHVMEASQYADLFLLGGKYNSSDYTVVTSSSFNPLGSNLFQPTLSAPTYIGY